MSYTIPPDTRTVGSGNPPLDIDDVSDVLAGNPPILFNVTNTAWAGGAKGDGVTHDDTAIQAAISNGTDSDYITVYLPMNAAGGVYLLNAPLVVTHPIRITGDSGVVIKTTGCGAFDFQNVYISPGHGTQLGMLEIDHLNFDVTGGHVFTNTNFNNFSFHDLRVVQRSGGYSIWDSQNASANLLAGLFTNCVFINQAAARTVPLWNIVSSINGGLALITWLSCHWANPGGDTAQFACFFTATTGHAYLNDLKFSNCTWDGAYGGCVRAQAVQGIYFDACHIIDTYPVPCTHSMFSIGPDAGSTWVPQNVSFRDCGRDLQGPDGASTWDIYLDATVQNVVIENYDVRDIPPGTNFFPYFNLNSAAGVVVTGCPNAVITNPGSATFLNGTTGVIPALYGSKVASGNLQLGSTSNATKGLVLLGGNAVYDDLHGKFAVGRQTTGSYFCEVDYSDTTTAGGLYVKNAGISTTPMAQWEGADVTANPVASRVTGDTFTRFLLGADGKMAWGPGNAARDANFYRSAAGLLTTDNSIDVAGHALGVWTPRNHGIVAWSEDPNLVNSGAAVTLGTIYLIGLQVNQAKTVTKLWWGINSTAGAATAAENFVGLFSPSGALLQSVGVDGRYATTGVFAETISVAVTPGLYWAAILLNGTGGTPQPYKVTAGGLSASLSNLNLSAATARYATAGTGQTSLASITPSASTPASHSYWAAIG